MQAYILLDNIAVQNSKLMSSVTGISGAINNYGYIAVFVAVFLVIFLGVIGLLIWSNKKQTKNIIDMYTLQTKNIIEQNKKLTENIVASEKQKEEEANNERNLIGTFIQLGAVLKDECKIALDKTKANRVGIYVCHNGTNSTTGLPFVKATCISESLSKKQLFGPVMMTEQTDIPLGIFYDAVERIYINDEYIVRDRNDIKNTDKIVYTYMERLGVVCNMIIAIRAHDGSPMGAVVIEFDTTIEDREFNAAHAAAEILAAKAIPVIDFSMFSGKHSMATKED